MECSNILNLIGLTLNGIGVVILFYTGLPAKAYDAAQYIETENTPDLIRTKSLSKFALALILLGIIFQILAVLMIE